ncbi:MAG TPA: hypothetical protein VJZ68_10310 [Nitrososphaera sp.]|nr:hypothetical protein [Nitrososphaera sp.]
MLKALYVLTIAVALATLVPVSLAFTPLGPEIGGSPELGVYDNAQSNIMDARGDAVAVYQKNGTEAIPQVRDYHDILGASVIKRGEAFFFTIDLAGNPNSNQEYETIYRWHVITTSQITNREQLYTIMFPNFAPGSSNSTTQGWYFAVFDNTANTFTVSPTKITDMPEDRIQFSVQGLFIGNPAKFAYWVDVLVRLNATLGEPDYLMDYAP